MVKIVIDRIKYVVKVKLNSERCSIYVSLSRLEKILQLHKDTEPAVKCRLFFQCQRFWIYSICTQNISCIVFSNMDN